MANQTNIFDIDALGELEEEDFDSIVAALRACSGTKTVYTDSETDRENGVWIDEVELETIAATLRMCSELQDA